MKNNHQGIVPLALVLLFVLIWLLLPAWAVKVVHLENQAIQTAHSADRLKEHSRLIADVMTPVSTALNDVIDPGTGMETIPRHVLLAISVWMRRGLMIKDLLPIGGLILSNTLLDVEVDRLIRLTNFSYPSPLRHRTTQWLLMAYLKGLLLSLLAPWPWPPYLLEGLWLTTPLIIHLHLTQTPKRT